MKNYSILVYFLTIVTFTNAQVTKVAILDFENTSGKTEYNALSGKNGQIDHPIPV